MGARRSVEGLAGLGEGRRGKGALLTMGIRRGGGQLAVEGRAEEVRWGSELRVMPRVAGHDGLLPHHKYVML